MAASPASPAAQLPAGRGPNTHLIGRPSMSALVFGWGRRKKKPEESQVAAAAAVAAADHEDGIPREQGGWEAGGGGAGRGGQAHGDGAGPAGRIDPATIEVSDVPMLLDEVARVRGKALVAGAVSLQDAMIPRLEKLCGILDELEEDDLDTEDADRRLQTIVERGKRQIISIIGQEARATLPDVETPDDAVALAESTARMLKKADDVLHRQSHVIGSSAKKYMGRIKPVLEATRDDYVALRELVVGQALTAEKSNRLREEIDRMDRSARSAERLRARAAELDSRLGGLRRRGAEIAGRIEALKSSPEHAALGRLHGELEALRGRRDAARRGMSDRFTKISKPLSRYEYVSAMDKEKMALLRAVIDSPFEAVASSGAGAVAEILGAARKAVESGSVTVKDKAKAVNTLDEEAGRLAACEEDAAAMAREEEAIRARIAEADTGRLSSLESDLAGNRAEADDTESKVRQMRAEADEADARGPELLARIEALVSEVTGVRYTVLPEGGGGGGRAA